MLGCAGTVKCLPGCLGTVAVGTCLDERRTLVSCQADAGVGSLTCVDGATYEVDRYCNVETNAVISCLFATR